MDEVASYRNVDITEREHTDIPVATSSGGEFRESDGEAAQRVLRIAETRNGIHVLVGRAKLQVVVDFNVDEA